MPEEIQRFKMYTVSPSLPSGQRELVDSFAAAFDRASQTRRWWGTDGEFRYSVVKCERLSDQVLFGFLTQEHSIQRHLYDDHKAETSEIVESYEDRLFVIDLQLGIVAFEWRQFRKQHPLSLPLMVQRMERILSDLASELGRHTQVALVEVYEETSKEKFVELFYENRVTQVVVDGFGQEEIPESIQLVNPIPGLEGALREIVSHDRIEAGIDKFIAETKSRQSGNLNRAAQVRAAMHSGQPKQICYEAANGERKTRKRVQRPELDVPITLNKDGAIDNAELAAATVVKEVRSLDISVPQSGSVRIQLTLFGGNEKQ